MSRAGTVSSATTAAVSPVIAIMLSHTSSTDTTSIYEDPDDEDEGRTETFYSACSHLGSESDIDTGVAGSWADSSFVPGVYVRRGDGDDACSSVPRQIKIGAQPVAIGASDWTALRAFSESACGQVSLRGVGAVQAVQARVWEVLRDGHTCGVEIVLCAATSAADGVAVRGGKAGVVDLGVRGETRTGGRGLDGVALRADEQRAGLMAFSMALPSTFRAVMAHAGTMSLGEGVEGGGCSVSERCSAWFD